MKKSLIITTVVLICFASIGGFAVGIAAKLALLDIFFSLTPTAPVLSETNIMVLGLDGAGGRRSDTIMVLHVDPGKKEASVISIPRDTIVTLPGRGLDKINHAYAYGGIELSRRTIEDFLHVSVPYTVSINLAGIQELIDQLGGITVDVEKRMYYVDYAGGLYIDLQPGVQKLNGRQAMGYLRFRHTDNDFARIGRQQKFLRALGDELMKQENVLRSPGVFFSLLACVDTNLNSREILALSLALRGAYELNRVNMSMIPGSDMLVDGIYYWKPSGNKVEQLVNRWLIKKSLASTSEKL